MHDPYENNPYRPQEEPWWSSEFLREFLRANVFVFVIALVGILLGVAVLFQVILPQTGTDSELEELRRLAQRVESGRSAGQEGRPGGSLTIYTQPEGVEVYIDDNPVGLTPLENHPLGIGVVALSLYKPAFESKDTLIYIAENRTSEFEFHLREGTGVSPPDPSDPIAALDTPPPAADEEPQSVEPVQTQSPPPVASQEPVVVEEIEEEEDEPAFGAVEILVRPWGSIYIDGDLHQRDTDVIYRTELPAGSHRITAVHPALGSLERRVEISGDGSESIVMDFNQTYTVTITSSPTFGEIYLNNRSTGYYTPQRLTLPAGEYIIDVRREGYQTRDGSRTLMLDSEQSEPVTFELVEDD